MSMNTTKSAKTGFFKKQSRSSVEKQADSPDKKPQKGTWRKTGKPASTAHTQGAGVSETDIEARKIQGAKIAEVARQEQKILSDAWGYVAKEDYQAVLQLLRGNTASIPVERCIQIGQMLLSTIDAGDTAAMTTARKLKIYNELQNITAWYLVDGFTREKVEDITVVETFWHEDELPDILQQQKIKVGHSEGFIEELNKKINALPAPAMENAQLVTKGATAQPVTEAASDFITDTKEIEEREKRVAEAMKKARIRAVTTAEAANQYDDPKTEQLESQPSKSRRRPPPPPKPPHTVRISTQPTQAPQSVEVRPDQEKSDTPNKHLKVSAAQRTCVINSFRSHLEQTKNQALSVSDIFNELLVRDVDRVMDSFLDSMTVEGKDTAWIMRTFYEQALDTELSKGAMETITNELALDTIATSLRNTPLEKTIQERSEFHAQRIMKFRKEPAFSDECDITGMIRKSGSTDLPAEKSAVTSPLSKEDEAATKHAVKHCIQSTIIQLVIARLETRMAKCLPQQLFGELGIVHTAAIRALNSIAYSDAPETPVQMTGTGTYFPDFSARVQTANPALEGATKIRPAILCAAPTVDQETDVEQQAVIRKMFDGTTLPEMAGMLHREETSWQEMVDRLHKETTRRVEKKDASESTGVQAVVVKITCDPLIILAYLVRHLECHNVELTPNILLKLTSMFAYGLDHPEHMIHTATADANALGVFRAVSLWRNAVKQITEQYKKKLGYVPESASDVYPLYWAYTFKALVKAKDKGEQTRDLPFNRLIADIANFKVVQAVHGDLEKFLQAMPRHFGEQLWNRFARPLQQGSSHKAIEPPPATLKTFCERVYSDPANAPAERKADLPGSLSRLFRDKITEQIDEDLARIKVCFSMTYGTEYPNNITEEDLQVFLIFTTFEALKSQLLSQMPIQRPKAEGGHKLGAETQAQLDCIVQEINTYNAGITDRVKTATEKLRSLKSIKQIQQKTDKLEATGTQTQVTHAADSIKKTEP